MKRRARAWAARYDALALRERWLLVVTAVAATILIGYAGFIDPANKQAHEAERRTSEHEAQLAAVRARSSAIKSSQNAPEVAARAELDALRKQLGEVAGRLAIMEASLVPPQRMASQLEEMIAPTKLRLLGIKTLPVAPVTLKAAEGASAASAGQTAGRGDALPTALYKHGIEIKVEGSYEDLVAYLERLEHAKLRLLWSSVLLSADAHPKLQLTLTVYTLSLDKTWLIV